MYNVHVVVRGMSYHNRISCANRVVDNYLPPGYIIHVPSYDDHINRAIEKPHACTPKQ